jgi:hypothetical protein
MMWNVQSGEDKCDLELATDSLESGADGSLFPDAVRGTTSLRTRET